LNCIGYESESLPIISHGVAKFISLAASKKSPAPQLLPTDPKNAIILTPYASPNGTGGFGIVFAMTDRKKPLRPTARCRLCFHRERTEKGGRGNEKRNRQKKIETTRHRIPSGRGRMYLDESGRCPISNL
jgi:hypothetical protein